MDDSGVSEDDPGSVAANSSKGSGDPSKLSSVAAAPRGGTRYRPRRLSLLKEGGRALRREAETRESRAALRFAAGTWLLALLLMVLGARPRGTGQIFRTEEAVPDPWAISLCVLILLLVAIQFVAVLLAMEHIARAKIVYWPVPVLRALVVTAVVLAVLVVLDTWAAKPEWLPLPPEWLTLPLDRVTLGAEALALIAIVYVNAVFQGRFDNSTAGYKRITGDDDIKVGEPRPSPTALESAAPRESFARAMRQVTEVRDEGGLAETSEDEVDESDLQGAGPLLAIGASGGGIRATAFVLGGYQAAQAVSNDPIEVQGSSELKHRSEPELFAVSGGSYMAAALALRRTYGADGNPYDDDMGDWQSAYNMDSPELERLRRHTRYLFEPSWRMRDGLVTLIIGAALSIFMVAVVLRFLSWMSAIVAARIGFIVPGDSLGCGRSGELGIACGWGKWDWLLWSSPALLAVLGIAILTTISWSETFEFDTSQEADDQGRERAARWIDTSARVRLSVSIAGILWVLLSAGLPAASVGVSMLASSNTPNALGGRILTSLGFATERMCKDALESNVQAAVRRANKQARVSPDNERTVKVGACGIETEVTRSIASKGDSDATNDVEVLLAEGAGRDLGDDGGLAGRLTGVGALLILILGLLRRGPSPEANVSAKWFSRAKRLLLTWLPLSLAAIAAMYVLLVWTFGFFTGMTSGLVLATLAVTAIAATMGFLIDANSTSLNGFYRNRLADAFAVGVDADERAVSLPPGKVYRFSHMASSSTSQRLPLHIVTTVNSQAPNEAPTMRGGFPLVFGPDEIHLFREERTEVAVNTAAYEEFAGPGRVSVMAAVAVSGAALSPLMGRFAVQMAPYRLLLALFNLRVGCWVYNPLHTGAVDTPPSAWSHWMWMTRKVGLLNVVREGVGRSSANERWIYLSDGGHLDNTGLVECVRRCVVDERRGRILILDASNDPVDSWSAVGDAIAVVRADLNVDLRRLEDEAGAPPWMRRYAGAGLDIIVVKAIRASEENPDNEPATWWDALPPNVQSFQKTHADFPRASTTRQKFGDLEFEAYRALGYAATVSSLRAAEWMTIDDVWID